MNPSTAKYMALRPNSKAFAAYIVNESLVIASAAVWNQRKDYVKGVYYDKHRNRCRKTCRLKGRTAALGAVEIGNIFLNIFNTGFLPVLCLFIFKSELYSDINKNAQKRTSSIETC